jgi:hypothetical protein
VGEARTGPRNVGLKRQPAMDADNGSPRRGLATPVDMLLRGFETTVYAIRFLLLVAAEVPYDVGWRESSPLWSHRIRQQQRSTTRRVRSCTDGTGQGGRARPAGVRTHGGDGTTIASEYKA